MTNGSRWTGIRAALEAPAWIGSKRLGELLALPDGAPAVPRPEPDHALRAARRALRVLSWIPGGRWRTSCLYESVAECLTLRRSGVPAAVCIGVKRLANGEAGIGAHAWVARNEADTRFHGFTTMESLVTELRTTTTGARPYHWLAAIPIVALLAGIPFVNRVEPYVFGLPLLIAWIVGWVVAMSATNGVIYLLDRRRERNGR